jgi:hypothetical protein
MKSYNHLLILLFSLIGLTTFAQTNKKTLNYQAVILDPKAIDIPGASIVGQPLNKGNVCLRFSLLNAQGGLDYEETQQVTTDEYGLVNVAIGTGSQAQASNSTSIYKSFDSILWNSSVKSLKVSVSYDGCNSFKQVSSQALNYTPYALYAEAVDYKNVRDAPTKLSQFSNDAGYLIPKDLDPLKSDIQTNSSKIEVANKSIADNKQASDATFLVVNQSITSLDNQVAQNTGSISNINTKIAEQQNQIVDNRNQITATNNNLNTQIGGLQGQLNTTNSTVNSLSGVAELVSNKSTATTLGGANPSDQLYPSQKAAKSYIDNAIYDAVGSGVPDATTLAAGKVKLAGDLGGTAANPTVPALANKENIGNKSSSVQADGGNDTKYPSVKAVKDYVDQAVNGTALQATVDGKADKLSPTFTGTPTAPTPASSDNSTKLATTAFVQAATSGIALQASVDAKADKLSPTFTGTPTAPTPASSDNSTKLATTAYVDAQVAAGAPEASSSSMGIIKLAGALGGTASSPTVPGLTLKEDLTNKSTAADLGATNASDEKYPSQKAVKTYVDNQVTSVTIPDASSLNKGKLQLAGDLAGTANEPLIATGAINSAKILDGSIATADIADLAITDGKIGGIAGTKVTGNIPGNAANVTGTVTVSHGGTGATDLTGYVKGNGTDAMTSVSVIPAADVDGAVRMVNGSPPDKDGKVTILFGKVSTGIYDNRPTFSLTNQNNGDIYIVSGDVITSHNGRTFIRDDNAWNEVSPNTASTDARYLRLGGGTMEGVLTIPTGKALILTDAPTGSTDAANKSYVDAKSAAAAPDASSSVSGKIKLAGDLGGTYDSPSVPGLAAKAPIDSPNFTGTVRGITKSMVGLENVENTSDANKPVSDATLTALNLKAPLASPTFSGTATFTGNVSGITATMVGLGNVTNKSEADLAISNATATALSAKENSANKSTATDLGGTNASDDKYPSQKAVKTYVAESLSSGAPDADGSTSGKIKLAGDLTGTAALPLVATSAITSEKIADGTIANIDISSSASISDSKLAEIVSSGKVNNSATTATAGNTPSAIVARDANGNFTAGTITATLTGNVTGNLTGNVTGNLTGDVTGNAATATKLAATKNINGVAFDGSSDITVTAAAGTLSGTSLNSTVTGSSLTSVGTLTDLTVTNAISGSVTGTAANVTGTVAVANGGTGTSTASPNLVFAGPTSGSTTAAPSFRALVAADLPTLNQNTSGTAANVTGTVAIINGGTGATTVADALIALGAQAANLSTDMVADASSTIKYPAVKSIKDYVDASVTSSEAPNATTSATGKIQLAGDLGGTNSLASAPVISNLAITTAKLAAGAVTSAKIANEEIINEDISPSAAITDTKLATIETGGKVSNSATTATYSNTASAIVARDANGNFSAGTITANLTGNVTGNLTGNVTGNAATATKLAATKNINGVAFDGSSDITVTAAAGTLSGTSLNSTVTGSSLTSVGTLTALTTSSDITVNGLTIGRGSGSLNNAENTAVGIGTLKVNSALGTTTQGVSNTAVGFNSLIANTTGSSLTALGHTALYKNTSGSNNVALGQAAMYNNTVGNNNVAIGNASLYTNSNTSGNTAIGKSAGQYLNNNNNTVIGAYSDLSDPTFTNATAIGYGARVKASNSIQLGADGTAINSGAIQTTAITNVMTSGTLTLKDVTYPNTHGSSNQVLTTTGSGTLTWTTPSTTATSFSGSLSGDVTGAQGSTVVGKINGVTLKNLASGLLKNATTTGQPSIATAGIDYLAGTSELSSGILKSTTGTGELAIAVASDFPTLNQNTTGNASTATTAGNITATSNTTLTSLSNLNTVGTITTGTWSGTAIEVAKGGTGATTAADALTNLGAQAVTNLSTDMVADASSTSKYPAVKSIKDYVDASVTSGAPNATTSATGKIQLAGDLGGTNSLASAPVISNLAITTAKLAAGAVTSAKIANEEIINEDISPSAAITDTKLATIETGGKVSNSATTATYSNTASAIVARDANGDFTAGTITANLTGNVTGNLTGNVTGNLAGNVTGNAATATKLAATKNINGVAFDGSSDITVTAAAGTLTGTSLNSTVTGSSLTSVGTLTNLTVTNAISGSVTGTAANVTGTVAVANGGTGTSTASPNVVFAGPTSGSTTAAPSFRALVAADIPTLNQNTTGNASTATTAGNITATSNTTLTSLSNLNTVGTITAGTWSGTAIAVEKGGTGLTTLSPNNVLLGNGTNALQVVAPGTSGNVLTSDGSTWKSTAPVASGVPYTGATTAVNLGAYDLTVNGVTVGRGNNKRDNNYVFGTNALASTIADDGTGAGNYNMAFGLNALKFNTTGKQNIAFGEIVLQSNIGGSFNTAMGVASLASNTTGSYNTGFGNSSLITNTTGSNNTALGYEADVSSNNLLNATAIGYKAKVNASNAIQLGNADITNVSTSGTLTLNTVTYPNTHGSSNQVLTTTGSGTLTWTTPAPAAGSTSIATVGTITTGTWSGTAIAGQNGGTGVNNSGKTITLGGNITTAGAFSTSGAFATTLTSSAATNVTLPTSGTLATLDGTETLTNKNSVGFKGATSGTATLAAPAVAGTTTITLPGATGTLATLAGTETLTNKNSVGFKGATSGTATLAAPAVAGTTTITLPGATGTLATLDGTETLTNKNSVGFKGATSGTATLAAPAVAGTTTITLPGATGTLATLAGAETLTNKVAITAKNYITTVNALPHSITAATSIDMSTGNIFQINLKANTTVSLTNLSPGTYIFEVIQHGNGTFYNITWPPAFKWSGGIPPTITATYGKWDVITLVYDGNYYFASAVQNF